MPLDLTNAFRGRHELLKWRDEECEYAAHHLEGNFPQLIEEADSAVDQASWLQLLSWSEFQNETIKPILEDWVSEQTDALINHANTSLNTHVASFLEQLSKEEQSTLEYSDLVQGVAGVAAVGAAGLAVPSLLGAATITTTTTSWLVFTTTASFVSLPLLLGGGAILLAVAAGGGFAAVSAQEKITNKIKENIRMRLYEAVIGFETKSEENRSLRQELQDYVSKSAQGQIEALIDE